MMTANMGSDLSHLLLEFSREGSARSERRVRRGPLPGLGAAMYVLLMLLGVRDWRGRTKQGWRRGERRRRGRESSMVALRSDGVVVGGIVSMERSLRVECSAESAD